MIENFFRKEFRKIFKTDFGKNVLTLFSGTSFSQLIPFFAAPVLTRLFTPEEFGLLALFITTSLFMGNISTMQYDSAIMLPESDEDAINVMALALICVSTVTLITLFVVTFFNSALSKMMNNQEISLWLYLVPLSVLLTGLFRILNIWASRKKQFKRLAMRNISQTTSATGTKLGMGFLSSIKGGLIVGSLVGQFFATTMLLYQTIIKDNLKSKVISLDRIKSNAIRYSDFPLYANLVGIIGMFRDTGSRYIISYFYGATILGGYTFTIGLLQKPAQLIGSAISQVYYQKAVKENNANKSIWALTKKLLTRLLVISLIIYSPILLFGESIFDFIFGSNWREAGLYAQVLSPWFLAHFIYQFSTRIPQILDEQKKFSYIISSYNLIFVVTIFLISLNNFSFFYILVSNTIIMLSMIVNLILWFRLISKN